MCKWLELIKTYNVNHSFWNIGKYLFYVKSDIHQVCEFKHTQSIIYIYQIKRHLKS